MTVPQFMADHLDKIKEIIAKVESQNGFDSHAFIRQFVHEFEVEYVKMLTQYSEQPFAKVHRQIAAFLADNQDKLHIVKAGKVPSQNIFGVENDNEAWHTTEK